MILMMSRDYFGMVKFFTIETTDIATIAYDMVLL